ncbi:MAG: heme-copper oxidase subunit III [Myxococcota bacterium]
MSVSASEMSMDRARPPRKELAPSGVIGMLIFVMAEIMFFAGLLSAFTITRATALLGIWPPPGQPRLPSEETLINTGALLLSGAILGIAHAQAKKGPAAVRLPLAAAMALGTAFLGLQGREWVAMLAQGLTLQSSVHGAFFYLIVGTHGVHAVAALLGLAYVLWRAIRGTLTPSQLYTAATFWYFVVLVWPVIYARLYY